MTPFRSQTRRKFFKTVFSSAVSSCAWLWIAAWCFLPTHAAGDVPMIPGSILAIAGFGAPHTLIEVAPDGTVLGELTVVDPGGLVGSPSGLTVLKGAVWISGTDRVFRLDPVTGGLSNAFIAEEPITGLADDGESLWVAAIHPDRLLRYDIAGNLLETIVLSELRLITGLDIDLSGGSAANGLRFLVSSYITGHAHLFDRSGQEVGVIETNLFPGNLTGLGLDPGGGSMWLTLGTGTNEIVHTDLDGNFLGEIPGSGMASGISGLEVLDASIFADGFESGTFGHWTVAP